MMNKVAHAFTLIELLVTLVVAILIISIAIPSYMSMLQNNKVVALANSFSASLNHARMEAIKRGSRVSVCPATNTSFTTCGSNTDWVKGWIVFSDDNNNNIIDSSADLVKVQEALPTGATATSNSNLIVFDASGFVLSGPFSLLLSASGCEGDNGRQINLSASGSLNVQRTTCP